MRTPDAVIAVWGLAYKENTASVKNSPSLATIAALARGQLVLHDPVVSASAARHAKAKGAADALEALRGADALMILTPWPDYRSIAPAAIASAMRGRVVLDPYAVLDACGRAAGGAALLYARPSGRELTMRRRSIDMLEHLLAQAQPPSRAVVIGSAGFVGGAIVKRLERENVPCLPLGRAELDLLAPDAGDTAARTARARRCRRGGRGDRAVQRYRDAGRQHAHRRRIGCRSWRALLSATWSISARTRSMPTAGAFDRGIACCADLAARRHASRPRDRDAAAGSMFRSPCCGRP